MVSSSDPHKTILSRFFPKLWPFLLGLLCWCLSASKNYGAPKVLALALFSFFMLCLENVIFLVLTSTVFVNSFILSLNTIHCWDWLLTQPQHLQNWLTSVSQILFLLWYALFQVMTTLSTGLLKQETLELSSIMLLANISPSNLDHFMPIAVMWVQTLTVCTDSVSQKCNRHSRQEALHAGLSQSI